MIGLETSCINHSDTKLKQITCVLPGVEVICMLLLYYLDDGQHFGLSFSQLKSALNYIAICKNKNCPKNVFSTKVDIAKLHTFLQARKQRNQFVIILRMTTSSKEGFLFVFKPLTPKIRLVILLTVCYTVLVMLVWRIWYWINLSSPNLYFSFFLITCLLHIVLIL